MYIGENAPEVGEKNSKCCADICHPEAKPVGVQDLRRFFAGAQNDIDISRLGILAQQEIPNRVRNDKKFFPLPQGARNGFSKHAAFTLAEVLITLGIIGIVAAMTIPTLIANYKEKELITRNKQAYSLVTQALNRIKADSSSMVLTDTINPNGDSAKVIADLSKYFKGSKVNNSRYNLKYVKPVEDVTTNTNNSSQMEVPNLRLTNGMIIGINLRPGCRREYTCTKYNEDGSAKLDENGNPIQGTCVEKYCAKFIVDVNGENLPNQLGRDAFTFYITQDNYEFLCSIFVGCIEDIIKYNKLPDNVVDYEIGGEFVK